MSFNLFKNKLEFPWDEKLTAQRLISIYYNYEFVSSVLSKTENTLLNKIINVHIKRLFFFFKRKNLDEISSYEIVAFILSKLLLNEFNQSFLKKIETIIEIQIIYNLSIYSKIKSEFILNDIKTPSYLLNK